MQIQPSEKRIKNFSEVALGLKKKQTLEEAQRCPQCSDPECVKGCPLGVDIPGAIRSIREGDFSKALHKIRERNSLAGICGRLCTAPCEQICILNKEENGSSIPARALERFVFDHGQSKFKQLFNEEKTNCINKKIAIVGSGPTGLMAGADLAKDGYAVTIFEALHLPGGSLGYRMPEFRLPKKVLQDEIGYILSLGIEIKTDCLIGCTYTIEQLFDMGYEAVLLATGSGIQSRPSILKEDYIGVHFAQDFLMRVNLLNANHSNHMTSPNIGDNVVVIGSGAKAIDCARSAVRLKKQVTILHPETEDDLGILQNEKNYAKDEGVRLEVLTTPVKIIADNELRVKAVECIRMDFADIDGKGEWKLTSVDGSEFIIGADTIIFAEESEPNTSILSKAPGLKINKDGSVWTKNEDQKTSLKGVFAAGGVVQGEMNLIDTLCDGKKAAQEIDNYIQERMEKNGSSNS